MLPAVTTGQPQILAQTVGAGWPSSASLTSMTAGSGWCRFRQPSFHTAVRSDHRMLSPASAISATSAKLDFPDLFRPVTTVSPGPACSWSATPAPMPRNPCTLIDG